MEILQKYVYCIDHQHGRHKTAKKCTKECDGHAKLSCLLNVLFFHVFVAVGLSGLQVPKGDVAREDSQRRKNPKFGRVRQVPIWELGWEFPGWDLSHFAKFGIFMGIL